MKKLLLLLLLVGVNANGADKPIKNGTGLEGFGNSDFSPEGVKIIVSVRNLNTPPNIASQSPLDKKAIENQAKSRLVQGGVEVNNKSVSLLQINAQPFAGYQTMIEPPNQGKGQFAMLQNLMLFELTARRFVKFEANGKEYYTLATVWKKGGIIGASGLKHVIKINMDAFLVDYLKANPPVKLD